MSTIKSDEAWISRNESHRKIPLPHFKRRMEGESLGWSHPKTMVEPEWLRKDDRAQERPLAPWRRAWQVGGRVPLVLMQFVDEEKSDGWDPPMEEEEATIGSGSGSIRRWRMMRKLDKEVWRIGTIRSMLGDRTVEGSTEIEGRRPIQTHSFFSSIQ